MSDWTDTLDARRAGLVEGFLAVDQPIEAGEQLDVPEQPPDPTETTQTAQRVKTPAKAPARKAAAKKTTAKRPTARVNK